MTEIRDSLLEPEATTECGTVTTPDTAEAILLYSIAISTKRIADALTDTAKLKEVFQELLFQPVNHYGEGLSEAIQMSIVRGLNKQEY
jgi:hypothetical protein